jgi:hypothetical protein
MSFTTPRVLHVTNCVSKDLASTETSRVLQSYGLTSVPFTARFSDLERGLLSFRVALPRGDTLATLVGKECA